MAKRTVKQEAADGHEYPRPQLVRDGWVNLNGTWDFAIDVPGELTSPEQVQWGKKILVPFTPETPMSGIGDTGFYKQVWYRRSIATPKVADGQRVLLHFGAVDYVARVWVNGKLATVHEGGYSPFYADITDLLAEGRQQTIEVCAEDDPHDLSKPRGKQDWLLEAHGIWYPRTTGIWQTVWLEVVPQTYIRKLHWTPKVEQSELMVQAHFGGVQQDGLRLRVRLSFRGKQLIDDTYAVQRMEVIRSMVIGDPGVEDFCMEILWTPEHPNLIDAELELLDPSGAVVDRVTSYTAMRSVGILGNRITLNRRPVYLRMALDQGYWEESGLTSPNDEALRRDVELAKQMGFNAVRKHQKIEDPRYLYWADRMGLMVWTEMPSPYRFDPLTIERTSREWGAAIERDRSHPCVICWVPFNESWGVPDLPKVKAQRDFVRSLYFATKAIDPEQRPCIGNDGWEAVVGDLLTIHDYDRDPQALKARYELTDEQFDQLFNRHRLGGRVILVDEYEHRGEPMLLTEFGGIGFSKKQGTWGYYRVNSEKELATNYTDLLQTVRTISTFAGYCYTQFTDTYQEANGLLYMDRTPKFSLDQMRKASGG